MTTDTVRIATRKSPLALWQAEHVAAELQRHHPGLAVELVTMTTRGDKILDSPLAKVGGKGLFVKELEQGMLEGRADLAVHSMKDVPVEFPEGLHLAVVMRRARPWLATRRPASSDRAVISRFDQRPCWRPEWPAARALTPNWAATSSHSIWPPEASQVVK